MRVCQTKFLILGHILGLDLIPALLYLFVHSGLCKAFSGLTYNLCLFVQVFGIHTSSSLWVHAVSLVLSLFACLFASFDACSVCLFVWPVWVHADPFFLCLFFGFVYLPPCLNFLFIRAIGCTYKLVYIYVARVRAAALVLCLGLHHAWGPAVQVPAVTLVRWVMFCRCGCPRLCLGLTAGPLCNRPGSESFPAIEAVGVRLEKGGTVTLNALGIQPCSGSYPVWTQAGLTYCAVYNNYVV
jgi:hypothetical protein